MTRRDFELVARVLRDPTLHLQDSKRLALASRFAEEFQRSNPNFRRQQFIEAVFAREER